MKTIPFALLLIASVLQAQTPDPREADKAALRALGARY